MSIKKKKIYILLGITVLTAPLLLCIGMVVILKTSMSQIFDLLPVYGAVFLLMAAPFAFAIILYVGLTSMYRVANSPSLDKFFENIQKPLEKYFSGFGKFLFALWCIFMAVVGLVIIIAIIEWAFRVVF